MSTQDDAVQTSMEALAELLATNEELHPELALYSEQLDKFGTCIRHPLVYSMIHSPAMNAWVNEQLRYKLAALKEARNKEQWHSYVFLHERPYRVQGFQDVMDAMNDGQYWDLLGTIWIDSENIRQNPDEWQDLLSSDRPCRHAIMSDDELEALGELPAVIPVYQGHTDEADDGWSWTTERATAEWFAQRFAMFEHSEPVLTEGTVAKQDVIAYFLGRGEAEIVTNRANVTIVKSTALRKREAQ